MTDSRSNNPTLPLPKWCLVLLGIPTFYIALAYLAIALVALGWLCSGEKLQGPPPDWPGVFVFVVPICLTFMLWPVYLAWAAFSKRLTWREKILWLFLITSLNMIGMAWFYVFIIRRYLGIEGRTGSRDEAALDRFLARCGVARGDLSSGQVAVLRCYCRTRRRARWLLIPALAFSALAIYGATVALPRRAIETFAHFSPQRIVVVDLAKSTGKELAADPESLRSQVQIAMIGGMMICMLATLALFIPFMFVDRLLPNDERRTLMEFLKASKTT